MGAVGSWGGDVLGMRRAGYGQLGFPRVHKSRVFYIVFRVSKNLVQIASNKVWDGAAPLSITPRPYPPGYGDTECGAADAGLWNRLSFRRVK